MKKRRLALMAVASAMACRPNVAAVIEAEPVARQPLTIVEAPPRAATTCTARTPAGAPLLIPEAAQWIVHMSPKAILRSPGYALFAAGIEQNSEWISMTKVFATCGYGVDRIEHVLAGFDSSEQFVAILLAPGIGRPELARCLVMEVQAGAGDQPIAEVTPMPGDPSVAVIELTDGRGYLFNEDMFVLTTTAWQAGVDRLSSCAGTPAVHGSLAATVRGLDVDAPMWIVGILPVEILTAISQAISLDPARVRSVGVSVRLDEGASATARVQMTEPAAADSAASSLRSAVGMMAAMMPVELSGVPNRILVETDDAELRLQVSLRLDELRYLSAL
jgi:hypothetical protein